MNEKNKMPVDKWSVIGIVALYVAIAILIALNYALYGELPRIPLHGAW